VGHYGILPRKERKEGILAKDSRTAGVSWKKKSPKTDLWLHQKGKNKCCASSAVGVTKEHLFHCSMEKMAGILTLCESKEKGERQYIH